MYVRSPWFWVVLLALSGRAIGAQAQEMEFVSDEAAKRSGLVREWFAQIEVDRSRGGVAHLTQHVSTLRGYTVFDVESPTGRTVVSEHDVDRFGDPLTISGAKRRADELAAKIREKHGKVKVSSRRVPAVTLYVTTDRGTVHAIDGLSGRTLWTAMFGKPDYPTTAVGANEKYAAVVNGSTMYVLGALDGNLQWERQLGGAPGAGPGLGGLFAFVPMVNGILESHNLEEPKQPTFYYQSYGRALIQPRTTEASVAWPTDKGHIYVARGNDAGLRFRLETNDAVVAPVSYAAPYFYATSIDGYVYCLHELSGDVVWRFSTGEPISELAAVVGGLVFVISENKSLYCLDAKTGEQRWTTGGVHRFLAGSNNRVYVLGHSGRLMSYDAKTGGAVGQITLSGVNLHLTNMETDRIYVGTRTGVIQCLRQLDLDIPLVHNQGTLSSAAAAPQPAPKAPQGPGVLQLLDEKKGEPAPAADPFGGEPAADPFGNPAPKAEGAAPKAAADDPFGK